jgi:hypothetical protein
MGVPRVFRCASRPHTAGLSHIRIRRLQALEVACLPRLALPSFSPATLLHVACFEFPNESFSGELDGSLLKWDLPPPGSSIYRHPDHRAHALGPELSKLTDLPR